MWVACPAPSPLFAGTATGLAALVLYCLITLVGYLAAPEQMNTSQTLGPAYLAPHVLQDCRRRSAVADREEAFRARLILIRPPRWWPDSVPAACKPG